MRCLISLIASSESKGGCARSPVSSLNRQPPSSAIDTNEPGRVDKAKVLRSLQSSGANYDLARETLKHVSVDASGKVELEDWVEVLPTRLSGI